MTTREQIIAAAKKADLQPYYDAQEVAIERFYSIAFDAGRVAEREECAKVCDHYTDFSSSPSNFSNNCAKSIRERSTHGAEAISEYQELKPGAKEEANAWASMRRTSI